MHGIIFHCDVLTVSSRDSTLLSERDTGPCEQSSANSVFPLSTLRDLGRLRYFLLSFAVNAAKRILNSANSAQCNPLLDTGQYSNDRGVANSNQYSTT
jgi:hypothetical protein